LVVQVNRHENTKGENTKTREVRFRGFVFRGFVYGSVLVTACSKAPAGTQAAAPASEPPSAAAPHGDHNPHHGGVVMMKGNDLHYEVVLDRSGKAQLFFTDAIREDLPASIASSVSLTIRQPGAPDEAIAMRIDEFGESWIGSGRPINITPDTTVRIAFTVHQEPYWIDVPYANPPAQR
jgi:hypothetical protein